MCYFYRITAVTVVLLLPLALKLTWNLPINKNSKVAITPSAEVMADWKINYVVGQMVDTEPTVSTAT